MSTSDHPALRWARLEEVLLASEYEIPGRRLDFLDLMQEIAVGKSGDTPGSLDYVWARAIAAEVWRMDRETSDSKDLDRVVTSQTGYNGRRRRIFSEIADRNVHKKLLVDTIAAHTRGWDLCRGSFTASKADKPGQVLKLVKGEGGP